VLVCEKDIKNENILNMYLLVCTIFLCTASLGTRGMASIFRYLAICTCKVVVVVAVKEELLEACVIIVK
jgi:hypothetical protein